MAAKSTRRAFLRGAALMAGSLVLSACQTKIVEQTVVVEKEVEKVVKETVVVEKTVMAEEQPTAVEQVMIGAFDVGPHGCPQCYDPLKRSVGYWWLTKMWAPLAFFDETGTQAIPELAESWEAASEDGKVWRVNLRSGLKWSDGEPLTVNDLYYQHKLYCDPDYSGELAANYAKYYVGGAEYAAGEAEEISGIKVVDDLTLEYTFVDPTPLFSVTNTYLEFAEHYWSQFTPQEIASGQHYHEPRPCCGPFVWSNYVQDQYTEAVANPNYWRGKPKLDKLINRYFDNETTAVLALQRGEIDFTYISRDVVPSLKQVSGYTVIAGSSGVANFIALNFREPLIQDERVRQAMMYAIDRDKIIETLYLGTAQKLNCLFSQAEYNPSDLIDYPYDPEKAKALLADANFQQTADWELITYYSDQLSMNVMQAIQKYWADVGIKATPRAVDVPTFNSFQPIGKDWVVCYIGQSHFRGAADAMGRWARDQRPDALGDCKDMHGCYPSIDEVTANLKLATASMDADERLAATLDVARTMNTELTDIWLWAAERYGAVNDRVKNFKFAPLPANQGFYDQSELWEIV